MADEKISQLSDAGAPQSSDQFVVARAGASLSILWSALSAAAGGAVSSVFGRTGAVTAQSGDYTAAQVGALPSTETLDQIATANATAASVAMNSHKLTGLAAGTTNGDSVRYEQIPTALPPNGTAGGDLSGTYPNPSVAPAANVAMGTHKLTGLAAGSGNGDSLRYEQLIGLYLLLTGGTMSGAIAMGAHKITGLTNGSASDDAAAFGQIPAALPPNGTAGGGLAGSYPNPTVNADVLTTKGDLLTQSANGTYSRLGIGSTAQVLNVASGLPAWATPPGFEIGYDQITATVTITSTTESSGTTVITCAAHTFDGSPVMVEFFSPSVDIAGAAGDYVTVSLFESTTQIGEFGSYEIAAFTTSSASTPFTGRLRFTPSAASHTYTVTAIKGGSTPTGHVQAGAGGTGANMPCFIRFTKV